MGQDNNVLKIVKKLKKNLKPSLFWPIWNTIICSGPPLNLIFRYFLIKDMENPTVAIILTVIAMIWIIIIWCWYVKERNNFNKDWEKVSIELQNLNLKEETSKDIIGTILNLLIITVISSLVMTIIFAAIAILTKLVVLKYLTFFCILVFLIAAVGLIIVGTILLFSFIKVVIKGGRLKKVLKRFILSYILSFIVLITISFFIHKNPEWIKAILSSFLIAFLIFVYTEVFVLYKEIKNTSSF